MLALLGRTGRLVTRRTMSQSVSDASEYGDLERLLLRDLDLLRDRDRLRERDLERETDLDRERDLEEELADLLLDFFFLPPFSLSLLALRRLETLSLSEASDIFADDDSFFISVMLS